MTTGIVAPRRLADGGEGPAAVRRRLLADHQDTLAGVVDAADAVAADHDGPAADAEGVTGPLSAALERRSLLEPLLAVLATAADAVGTDLPHEPAAAPPYLTVTSRGPVLRATTDAGRLVVVGGVFAVERSGESVRYVRTGDRPAEVLTVELHRGGDRTVAGPDDATSGSEGASTDGDGRDGGQR